MSRKKHQDDPDWDESTESCDENENLSECKHVKRAVDMTLVKKALIAKGFQEDCEQCKKINSSDVEENDADEYEYDKSLWLCLRCGNQACGRSCNQHALEHFKTPHSDSHSLCVNMNKWDVWCYDCDNVVNATCHKKLQQAIDYLRSKAVKQLSVNKVQSANELYQLSVVPFSNVKDNDDDLLNSKLSYAVRPRGLTNLGNTCFFNSVMQCLAQTPYLLSLLKETEHAGKQFYLPGGKLISEEGDSIILEPLEGTLDKWQNLTQALAETLDEMQNGRQEVFCPRLLHMRLTARMPQFAGGDQHDSHEVLRHLLEAVREEDLKRYQVVILENLGFNRKTIPNTVPEEKKKIIKFYGQQASEMLLPTEQVFRGVLVSTLQCQECQHTSHIDEFFLDLSLPISEKQLPIVLRRKAEDTIEDASKLSKHQIKKEKLFYSRKSSRKTYNKMNTINLEDTVICDVVPMEDDDDNNNNKNNSNNNNNSDNETDADLQVDNKDDDNTNIKTIENINNDGNKGIESGYNSDKVYNSSPDSNNRDIISQSDMPCIDDSGVPSPIPMVNTNLSSSSSSSSSSASASSETNIEMSGSPIVCRCSLDEEETNDDEFKSRPESRLSFIKGDLKMDLSKLSLINDNGISNKLLNNLCTKDTETSTNIESSTTTTYYGPPWSNNINSNEEKMEQDYDDDLWTETISVRYQCEDGESSIQSCLNQFTACELLTDNNKVCCDLCTKRHSGNEKKTVYTNATKQLLIYNPPAVLILHLKRFQVQRYRSAKVSKFIKFPTILDLASFCSKRSQDLPTFESGQTKVLYSLYGVVEHSGSIHGGHYVAYVKVRKSLDEKSYRWEFLPKNQQKVNVKKDFNKNREQEFDIPDGKWYYISDSHVSETTESKVLHAQAYLLFYERIL